MSYAASLATAKRLLTSKGQPVTLTNHVGGAYDPSTASVAVVDTPITTVGVLLPLSSGVRGFKYGTAEQPNTNTLSSDQTLLLPGDIAEPLVGATAAIGTKNYTLISVSPLNPGGTVVLYEAVIRGAA